MNYGKKISKVVITDGNGISNVLHSTLLTGEVCRIDYQRSNGKLTTMLVRTGVSKYVTGRGTSPTNLDKDRLSVWSFDRQGYRTLKLNKVLTIKHGGILYDFRNAFAVAALKVGNINAALRLITEAGEYGYDLSFGERTAPACAGFPSYK
jgi:hypothetical protein